MANKPLFIGVMSGSSLDGIDVALTEVNDTNCQVIATQFLAYPPALKETLLSLHVPTKNELEICATTANQLASLYAQAIHDLLNKSKITADEILAIGNHGQTIRHCPKDTENTGFTIQIGNNALLAELTNITVVGDFRSRDIAAGGQGAPLVPAFHHAFFANADKNRAIINIGGIANITYLAKTGEVLGFDSGPGNMLLDHWVKQKTGKAYDVNGEWSATGIVLESCLNSMLSEPYFAKLPPKSTGRDLFSSAWLQQHILYPHCRPEDIARTLVALTAHTLAQAIKLHCHHVDEIYLCGGGVHNTLLIQDLQTLLNIKIATTDILGVGADWVEAAAFAWLAKQTLTNKTSNLPAVTGAKAPRVLGAIYPK